MQDKHHESAECFLFDEVLKLMAIINVQSYLKKSHHDLHSHP